MSYAYEWYDDVVINGVTRQGSIYRKVSDTVKISSSVSPVYIYNRSNETGEISEATSKNKDANSTSNVVFYGSNTTAVGPVIICVWFESDDARYGAGDRLPIGMYLSESTFMAQSRIYGLSDSTGVTDFDSLINVWVPPIVDDPVYQFLRDQSKSSVAAGTVITRRSLTSEKLYRIGYANRTTTQKDVEIPTPELVVHETKTGDVYALDKTAHDIYKAYTNQHPVTLIGFNMAEYTLSSVVDDPYASFTFTPVSGSYGALKFTASSPDSYPSRSGK